MYGLRTVFPTVVQANFVSRKNESGYNSVAVQAELAQISAQTVVIAELTYYKRAWAKLSTGIPITYLWGIGIGACDAC